MRNPDTVHRMLFYERTAFCYLDYPTLQTQKSIDKQWVQTTLLHLQCRMIDCTLQPIRQKEHKHSVKNMDDNCVFQ